MELAGRVAVVTGASRGIGLAVAAGRTANVNGSNFVIDGGLVKTT